MTYDIYKPTRRQQLKDSILFRTYTARQFVELLAEVPECARPKRQMSQKTARAVGESLWRHRTRLRLPRRVAFESQTKACHAKPASESAGAQASGVTNSTPVPTKLATVATGWSSSTSSVNPQPRRTWS